MRLPPTSLESGRTLAYVVHHWGTRWLCIELLYCSLVSKLNKIFTSVSFLFGPCHKFSNSIILHSTWLKMENGHNTIKLNNLVKVIQ